MKSFFNTIQRTIKSNVTLSVAILLIVLFAVILYVDKGTKGGDESMLPNAGQEQNATSTTSTGTTTTSSKPGVSTKPQTIAKNTVLYSNGRFTPATITVKAGSTVTFINQSSQSMRVKHVETAIGLPTYNEFLQESTVGKGGIFKFVFLKRGSWNYYNMSNAKATGTIVVE